MTRYFGTDGVRGIANKELTCKMAFALGVVAAELLGKKIVVGRDTRRSGAMLEAAFAAGVMAAGGDALVAGIVPTPAVAHTTRELKAAGGVVISASHNPPQYNGIKFFDADGFKPSNELEEALEQRLHVLLEDSEALGAALVTGSAIGTLRALDNAVEDYIEHALTSIMDRTGTLTGITVAIDCGHGASAHTTPEAFERMGATVFAINTDYNGDDINVKSGSTHLEPLIELVKRTHADIGIAHDGDADRVIAVDARGEIIDGDYIEIICAYDMKKRGALAHNTIVSTVMCNLGFTKAAQELGITVIQTAVGDSNVLAAMRKDGYILGGEQSGHMIFLENNTTGDGLITALQLVAVMKTRGKSLEELARVMQKYPQVLINVPISRSIDRATLKNVNEDAALLLANKQVERELEAAGGGRVLIRASGTEPLIRVMVEAATEEEAQQQAAVLAEIVGQRFGEASA